VLVVLTLVLQLVEQLIVHQEEVLELLVLYLRVMPHLEVLVVEDNIDQLVQDLVEQVMLEDIVHQKETQVE
tara:strand:- start:376 stop:588 length:213 start_codon:yes stop_codon:yes gene_type:complete